MRNQRYVMLRPIPAAEPALLGGIIMLLLGALLLGRGWHTHRQYHHEMHLLQAEGVVGLARINAKETVINGDAMAYYVNYSFAAPVAGQSVTFEDSAGVPMDFYYTVTPGDQIEVLYARSNPRITHIYPLQATGTERDVALFQLLSGSVCALTGLWGFKTYHTLRRQKRTSGLHV